MSEQRLRLCESAITSLAAATSMRASRNVLLRLPQDQGRAELYDELLDRIETHYVLSGWHLSRACCGIGLDNLEIALRDPAFLKVNAPGRRARAGQAAPAKRCGSRRPSEFSSRGRDDARVPARGLGLRERGPRAAGINPAAVVLEFTFGACDALDDYTSYLTARPSGRPLRRDRRQLRGARRRAVARRGGGVGGERAARRPGLGCRAAAGRQDHGTSAAWRRKGLQGSTRRRASFKEDEGTAVEGRHAVPFWARRSD